MQLLKEERRTLSPNIAQRTFFELSGSRDQREREILADEALWAVCRYWQRAHGAVPKREQESRQEYDKRV